MHEDLSLARFRLEAHWSDLIPAGTSVAREPSGEIALSIPRMGLRQIARNGAKLVHVAGVPVHIYCPARSEKLLLRFTSGL